MFHKHPMTATQLWRSKLLMKDEAKHESKVIASEECCGVCPRHLANPSIKLSALPPPVEIMSKERN